MAAVLAPAPDRPLTVEECKALLSSRTWRMNNLYWIQDAAGNTVRFQMNAVQAKLDAQLHNRNIVPKSRKHGITTWACLRALDTALFRAGSSSGIVAHLKELAIEFFGKILFAYDRLPEWLKQGVPIIKRDMNGTLELANSSKIHVSVSHRGGTLQFLHVSEYGPLCALTPKKAEEVRSGALNTVMEGVDAIVTIESTAYGSTGDFADKVKDAEKLQNEVKAGRSILTTMDYKLHFFAWHEDPRNTMNPVGVVISTKDEQYFQTVEALCGTKLSLGQRAWYIKKREEQKDLMQREHPSTLAEAFNASIEGAYYVKEMAACRALGHIHGNIPFTKGVLVDTFWDLGVNDCTAIIFHQYVALEHRFLLAYSMSGMGVEHYSQYLDDQAKERGWKYGIHHLPHDATNKSLMSPQLSPFGKLSLMRKGEHCIVVPRVERVMDGIRETRTKMGTDVNGVMASNVHFDEVGCGSQDPVGAGQPRRLGLIEALDRYRKRWNTTTQTWSDEALHDESSNFADAFRQWGQGWRAPSHRTAAQTVVPRGRSPA